MPPPMKRDTNKIRPIRTIMAIMGAPLAGRLKVRLDDPVASTLPGSPPPANPCPFIDILYGAPQVAVQGVQPSQFSPAVSAPNQISTAATGASRTYSGRRERSSE